MAAEMNVMEVEDQKNFFETAWEGICEAPVESKILAGVVAGVTTLGIGVGCFFGGKAYGEKKCAADFDPAAEKEEVKEEVKEEQPQQQAS